MSGADVQNRTGDLVLTKDALCQLSYIGLGTCGAPADRSAALVHTSIACHPKPARTPGERRMERETGIEPATNSLEGCDSTTELLPPTRPLFSISRCGGQARRRTSRPSASPACQPAARGASEGWWRGKDSNLRSPEATDLQSAAFDRFATSPIVVLNVASTRTLRRSSPMELAEGFEPPTG